MTKLERLEREHRGLQAEITSSIFEFLPLILSTICSHSFLSLKIYIWANILFLLLFIQINIYFIQFKKPKKKHIKNIFLQIKISQGFPACFTFLSFYSLSEAKAPRLSEKHEFPLR